jgi:triacylglycerol lipase
MGPFSSNHERACEAYAQLTGTRVDYGLARSRRFGHDRYGKDYTSAGPLIPGFGTDPTVKVHLIGLSMGGPTSRMLAYYLEYGLQEEEDASKEANEQVSPLFATKKSVPNPIFSSVSLAYVSRLLSL